MQGEEESSTIVSDVLEAVGLAQHAKGIVAGEEEELVPGEAKVAGAKKEEKRKTA
jgi:hypothetical protein